MTGNKVIVIGLDGATFELLQPWIDAGWLPNVKAMLAAGVSGELTSCVPPITAPAWTSFMTGKNPGKHGVFDFVTQDRKTYESRPVNSHHVREKVLWEAIGEQGGQVVVMNVPMTDPPHPVKGAIISDFLLATGDGASSFPPDLLRELEEKFGTYPADIVLPYFVFTQADEDLRQFIRGYRDAMEYKFRVARYLRGRFAPDFLMVHLYGNDQISHWLWHVFDRTHPEYRREEAERRFPIVFEYYSAFDACIGELRAEIGEDTSLFIVSDHGFGAVHKAIDLNTWLYHEGYLVTKAKMPTKLRQVAWRLGLSPNAVSFLGRTGLARALTRTVHYRWAQAPRAVVDLVRPLHKAVRLLLSYRDIDWSRTTAFSPLGYGQIQINVQRRWAKGSVAPGSEYERLKGELLQKLAALRDPDTGETLCAHLLPKAKDEMYFGEAFEDAPDIVIVPLSARYRLKSVGFTSNKAISRFFGMTGVHKMNGVLIGCGAPMHGGTRIDGAQLIDLFPSILYLMGMPVPPDVDGKILHGMFTYEFRAQHPVKLGDEDADVRKGAPKPGAQDAEDAEAVIERLKALGYLD